MSRFGLYGTDLGSSFEHGGRLWFLFGDTWPGPSPTNHFDSVAWTTDAQPEPGISLEFVNDDRKYRSPRLSGPSGVGLSKLEFEVPIAGFSANGQMYVFHTADHFKQGGKNYMGRTMLMKAPHGDPTDLHWVCDVSVLGAEGRFINVACAVSATSIPGLPFAEPVLLAWGSGRYRESHAYFGCVPLAAVEQRPAWRFFAGIEAGSLRPLWVPAESAAAPLFLHPQIGELSVSWVAPLGLWLMLYNAASPRGINARVASRPWGPWSPPIIVFDPGWPGLGYGHFMHVANGSDKSFDPGRAHEWGGEYGPYLIDRYTRRADTVQQGARVYFVMSTWNPYTTVLMTATLAREEDRPTTAGVPSMVIAGLGRLGRNFEVALPRADGGLLHLARSADAWLPPWGRSHLAGSESGRIDADRPTLQFVSMASTTVRETSGILQVAATTGSRVVTWWREREDPWRWHGPFPVVTDRGDQIQPVSGNPALIQSRHGSRGQNLELVVPHRDRGIHHVWWDADLTIPCWRPAPLFGTELGHVDAVTLIQSTFGDPGNLELVARVNDRLWSFWRQSGGDHVWQGPFPLIADGTPVTGIAGVPSIIQGGFGIEGRNFELAAPLASGGIAVMWRDNDAVNPAQFVWHRHVVIDPSHAYYGVSLLQGPFGDRPGNLELIANGALGLAHFWRDAPTKRWAGPFAIPLD